jgi:hypothetical protein
MQNAKCKMQNAKCKRKERPIDALLTIAFLSVLWHLAFSIWH